jgi:N6-adenosine-specific RNA methylase IME4
MTTLEYHPLANLFPLIEGPDFEEFCAGIKADGILHDKIVLLDGKILDGRNRYRACRATGVTPHYETFNPKIHGDPLTFVISKNLHRRHLDKSQRAQIAAESETLRHGGDRRSDQDANLHLDRATRAEQFGVSERSIATAAEVRDHGVPELREAVKAGEVTVTAAVEIVRSMPVEEQRKLLADVAEAPDTKKAFSGVVKDLRRKKQDEKKAKRLDKVRDLGDKMRALPDEKYGVILADPEWPFEVWSEDTGQDRAAANHYPTSTIEVIKSRPVAAIAAAECVLGLWATVPKLPAALDVMREWGFTYVTHITWVKDRIGTGYWFRNNHEILLIGKKGAPPKPADGTQWRSAIVAPRGAHSEKPDFQYEFFETFFAGWPAIELNARRRRHGWKAWGLEAPEDQPTSTDNIIRLGDGTSIPPDVGIGLADDYPDEIDVMADEKGGGREQGASTALGRIVSVETWPGPASEHMPEPYAKIIVEGEPPAGLITDKIADIIIKHPTIPFDRITIERDEAEVDARYPGRLLEVRFNQFASPPSIDLITEGGEVDPWILDVNAKRIRDNYPDITGWRVTENGKPAGWPTATALRPETSARTNGGDHETVADESDVAKEKPLDLNGSEAVETSHTPAASDSDDEPIPTFLRRGHPDCIVKGEGGSP